MGETKTTNLEQTMEEARSAVHARDIFLANMSHEIRTPINTMLGLTELILRESGEEAVREYAMDIKQAGAVLLSLVSDILDFSSIQSGKMELVDSPYDVSSLLNDLINSISIPLRKNKLKLSLHIAKDIPHKLSGDEIHLRQIIGNLLSNAAKYNKPKGTVTLDVSWKPISDGEILLEVSVKDTGTGINKEDLDRIFEAFHRLDMEASRTEEGTGLGLAVSNRLVEMMGGQLHVESTPGKGSTFSFAVSQKIADSVPLGDFESQYNKSTQEVSDYQQKFIAPLGKILVVDDNTMNQVVAQSLLKQTKLQVDVASSGEECLEMLKRKEYHLICMDHMMPVMDGIETLHAIRALQNNPSKDIPVIALTANAVVGAREYYLKEGFQDYLTKPIEGEKFEEMLIKYLPKELVYISDEEEEEVEEETGTLDEKLLEDLGVHVENGLRYMGGSESLFENVLSDFREVLTEKENQLKVLLAKGDMPGYAIIVHALKGNARNVGADDLADNAYELEKASRDGMLEDVEVRSPLLFRMIETLSDGLNRYFANREAANGAKKGASASEAKPQEKKELSEQEIMEKLAALNQQLDDFDGDAAAATIAELKECKLSDEDRKVVRLCDKAVSDFAFDVAMEVIASVLTTQKE